MAFTAIFDKAPKPNDRSTVIGAAIYTCQVGAYFAFKVFCGVLYELGELDGETERIEAFCATYHGRKVLNELNLVSNELNLILNSTAVCT